MGGVKRRTRIHFSVTTPCDMELEVAQASSLAEINIKNVNKLGSVSEESVPRGISPQLLVSQVKNTAPFLFEDGFYRRGDPQYGYLEFLQTFQEPLSHLDYFRLCLAAHHSTVGTFVPTDVDNQIRFKLWSPKLPLDTLRSMAELVVETLQWDTTRVSTRWIRGPKEGGLLSGHQGEWLSTAAGAYGAFRKKDPEIAAWIGSEIAKEVIREAAVLKDCVRARDGVRILKASTILAHNLGDLDRVLDQWAVPEGDPLREGYYKAAHRETPFAGNLLRLAGDLNKKCMADENHRHFVLRAEKPLRRSADLLLPIGPFFDDWGRTVALHPLLQPKEIGQIVEALLKGFERLKTSVGYARALVGIQGGFKGGMGELKNYLPSRVFRDLKSGHLRTLTAVPRSRFEEQWAQVAFQFFK